MNNSKEGAGKANLNINYGKSKSTIIGTEPAHFTLEGSSMETVDCYKYIGSQITLTGC